MLGENDACALASWMTSKQSLARMLSPVLLAFYQDTRLLIAHFFILAFVFLFGFGFGFGLFVLCETPQ